MIYLEDLIINDGYLHMNKSLRIQLKNLIVSIDYL